LLHTNIHISEILFIIQKTKIICQFIPIIKIEFMRILIHTTYLFNKFILTTLDYLFLFDKMDRKTDTKIIEFITIVPNSTFKI